MTGGVFSEAREVAEGVEEKRVVRVQAEEAKAAKEKAIADARKRLIDGATAAVDALDSKLHPVFNRMAQVFKKAGLEKFNYERQEESKHEFARGKSVRYRFSAPYAESLKIRLFVDERNESNRVSCGIIDLQAVEENKWPIEIVDGMQNLEEEWTSSDGEWGGWTTIGYEDVKRHYAVEIVNTPPAPDPIEKAFKGWFRSVAQKNENFSHIVATGKVSAQDVLPDISSLIEQTTSSESSMRGDHIKTESVSGTAKYHR